MPINQTNQVDYLFKKIGYGVSKTDTTTNKTPSNESIPSPLTLRGDNIWQQSVSVPTTIPVSNSSVVALYSDSLSSTVQTSPDLTSSSKRTWKTGLTNWIDPSFGATYQVKVYIAPASNSAPQTYGTQLFADGTGADDEWFFDYNSGVLTFPDNIPTSVSGSSGNIYISGARYTGQLGISNFVGTTTFSNINVGGTSAFTGNITTGNITVTGNINVAVGAVASYNGIFYGNTAGFGALYAGVVGYTPQAQTTIQVSSNFNGYAQLNQQNINSGALASSDFIGTADNGNANDTYVDLGIASSTYNYPGFTLIKPNDGYLIAYGNATTGGGNLILATGAQNDIVFAVGGVNSNNEVMRITRGNVIAVESTIASTSTTTGALTVAGGVGIVGNLYSGGNHVVGGNLSVAGNATVGNISTTNINLSTITSAANLVLTPGTSNVVVINSTTAVELPIGNIAQRPTGVTGYLRYNTELSTVEFYNGAGWVPTSSTIADQTIYGDGTTQTFTLNQSAIAIGLLVSINGTLQQPNVAYTVSGTQITFAEIPQSYDVIDVRFISASYTINMSSYNGAISGTTLALTSTATSTSTSTGALTVAGGAGIAGNVYAGAVYTNGLYWAGNGTVISTGSGGGNYSNSNVAAYLPTYTGTFGTLSSLTTSGTTTTGNLITTNGIFWANGTAYSSGSGSSYGNTQVAQYLPTYTGTFGSLSSLSVAGDTNITGNVIAQKANLYSTVAGGVTSILARLPSSPNYQIGVINGFGSGQDSLYGRIAGGSNIDAGGAVESYIDFVAGASLGTGYIRVGTGNSPLLYANTNGVNIISTTTSTNTTTGALTVAGGAGIGGNVFAGGNVNDSIGNVRDFTLNTQSTAYTLVSSDDSKLINTTANVVIPTGVFTAGQTVTIFNNSSSNIYVTSGATVYSAGTSNTGTRILAQRGLSTIVCVASNTFVISGAGLY